ncbi:Prefoldin subunit-domain-containing protein [Globomyces pollinis-pini]|nr:Prefoldin subunit-domain-containing protein [Globomyces pollinis-pini]
MSIDHQNPTVQIQKYKDFIIQVLEPDLTRMILKRKESQSIQSQYVQLKDHINLMKSNKEMETMMNAGCDFYLKTQIMDQNRIVMSIGLDYYVEMELDKALTFVDGKINRLEEIQNQDTLKISEIRAHISAILQTIQMIHHSAK